MSDSRGYGAIGLCEVLYEKRSNVNWTENSD